MYTLGLLGVIVVVVGLVCGLIIAVNDSLQKGFAVGVIIAGVGFVFIALSTYYEFPYSPRNRQ
jgi:hypothetical protein